MRLAGKVAVVTGGAKGLGMEMALKFANEGWLVAASARRENLLQDLNKENSNLRFNFLGFNNEQPKWNHDLNNEMKKTCLSCF